MNTVFILIFLITFSFVGFWTIVEILDIHHRKKNNSIKYNKNDKPNKKLFEFVDFEIKEN